MKRTYAYGAATSQGRWHVQEDGFYADPGSGIFALADGFGGRGCGDIAAKLALQAVRGISSVGQLSQEASVYSPTQLRHRDLFQSINGKLLGWNEKRASNQRGGCSLILASVEREHELTLTTCGSCSAFLLRAGHWIPLLTPQGQPRADLRDVTFPTQALGLGREISPETRSLFWQAGDILLLFSGGLYWESDSLQADLLAQLSLRVPGSDLSAVVTFAAENGAPEALWNQTAIAVEALV